MKHFFYLVAPKTNDLLFLPYRLWENFYSTHFYVRAFLDGVMISLNLQIFIFRIWLKCKMTGISFFIPTWGTEYTWIILPFFS